MVKIKWKHAYIDEEYSNRISIDEITEDNRNKYKFFCIGCGRELRPRALNSDKKSPHFYHKGKVECSGETYLHKLAKRIIKEKFDLSEHFYIEYRISRICINENCKFKNDRCYNVEFQKIDLKEYYDTCTLEEPIGNYVADVLLTNSKNTDLPPVLIEICVSHSCEDDKRNAGLKIIEIEIQSEEDAEKLGKEEVLKENTICLKGERRIEFISFKKELKETRTRKVTRYIYDPQLNAEGYISYIDCTKTAYKSRLNSTLELNLHNTKSIEEGDIFLVQCWMNKYKGIRRCNLCKFYYDSICRLNRKRGGQVCPSTDEAEKCKSFWLRLPLQTIDQYLQDYFIEEISELPPQIKPEYKVIITASKHFTNYKLFKEKVNYYLSDKITTHSIIIMCDATLFSEIFIRSLSKEADYIVEPHKAEWHKYDKNEAIKRSNEGMISQADALIAFWDGKSLAIKDLIGRAHKKGIKVALVKIKVPEVNKADIIY